VEKYDRDRQSTNDNIVRRMCIACWIAKAADAHSEYEVLIAVSWQQWLRERTALLAYIYAARFVRLFDCRYRGLPNNLCLNGFPTKSVYAFLFFPIRATCLTLHFKLFCAKYSLA
jgi:hypothetical protein